MEEYIVLIDGHKTTRYGYSPDHVMDEILEENPDANVSILPPLPFHTDIEIGLYTAEQNLFRENPVKVIKPCELQISQRDYEDREELFELIKSTIKRSEEFKGFRPRLLN